MNVLSVLAVCLCAALLPSTLQHSTGWQGIVPLHSRRIDVEKLLGRPERVGDVSVYKTKMGLVEVHYASARCKGPTLGWNVAHDTVLEIRLAPDNEKQVTIDEKRFAKAYGHIMRPTYINLDEGVRYELLPGGTIYAISYIPTRVTAHLRCPGFPPYDGGLTQYRPFDIFGNTRTTDTEARLDNFAATLSSDPTSIGYVIVYAGQRARVSEAKTAAQRVRSYLIEKRGIAVSQIVVTDGGYRQNFEIELYIVPRDLPRPTPTPTLATSEVKIDRSAIRRKPSVARRRAR